MAWRGWSVWNGSLRASCSLVAACRWDPWRLHGSVMTVMGWSWRNGGYHTMEFFWTDLVLKQALDLELVIPHDWESPYLSHKKDDGIWPWQTQGLSLPKMTREIGDSLLKKWDEMVSEMGFLWGKFGWRLLRQFSQVMMSKGLKYGTESNEASGREPTVSCVARSLMN